MGSEVPWRRLHPASVAVNLVPRAWRVVRNIWPLFLAMLYGGRGDATGVVDLFVISLFFVMTVGSTVVHYLTLRYRVADGRLELHSGLMNRQVRLIDPRRIQNMELSRNLFQRATGLVEVRIETASGTEVEGLLSALSQQDGQELLDQLDLARRAAGATEPEEGQAGDLLVANSTADLLRYGATATRFGAGALVVVGLAMEGLQLLDPTEVDDVGGFLGGEALFAIGVAVLTGTWLFGTLSALVAHHAFRLTQVGERLVATEGLFTQRRVELRASKIQLVTFKEPVLRRALGFGSLHIETAAARAGEGGTVSAEAMVPVVERGDVAALVQRALPRIDPSLWRGDLHPPHPLALRRRLLGGTFRWGLVAAFVVWMWFPWGLLGLLLLPLAALTTWLDHRHQGWGVTDDAVLARQGYLYRTSALLPRDKVQSIEVRAGIFRRRWGLGQLALRVAGSTVTLPDLGWDEALALQDDLLRTASLGRRGPGQQVDQHDASGRGEDPAGGPGQGEHEQERTSEQPPGSDAQPSGVGGGAQDLHEGDAEQDDTTESDRETEG